MERSGFAADFRDSEDCTLLHWAAINNRLKIAEYLISKSADVNAVGGSNREIPLQWCVRQHGCVKLVQLLIDAGSDLHHKSVYNLDSLFIAVQCGHVYGTYILLCSGANPNTVNARGDTPLYWLIKNQIENVRDLQRLLLRFGSSVSHQNGQGNNAMHVVAETNVVDFDFLQTALLIYKSVLDPNSLMVKNNAGLTPQEVQL